MALCDPSKKTPDQVCLGRPDHTASRPATLFDPNGRVEGVIGWHPTNTTTVEQAHKRLTRHKPDRMHQIRSGWTLRREEPSDRDVLLQRAMEGDG